MTWALAVLVFLATNALSFAAGRTYRKPPREGVVLSTEGLTALVQWDAGQPPEAILFGYLQAMPSDVKVTA